MESWDVRSLALGPHHPQVLRSDNEIRATAIRLPSGEGYNSITSTSARTCSSPTARSRSLTASRGGRSPVLAEREASSTQVPGEEGVELRRTADGKGDGVMATRRSRPARP